MSPRPRIPPLVGIAEIADMAAPGTRAATVSNWRYRYSDFPRPAIEFKMGPVFHEADVLAWLSAHPKLGGNRPSLEAQTRQDVRAAVTAGSTNVTALAEQFGCSRTSIYNIAGDLLFEES